MSFTKKLTSSLVASSLVLGMVSTAFAAPSAEEVNAGYTRLNHYGIVQGKADGTGAVTPALEDPITRAELLTILVRAWGQEANAKLLKGATTGFADVDGVAGLDWATGYVFIGSRLAQENGGQALGTGAGTFNPNGQLTGVQTLAFTMKFLGLTVPGGANWAADTVKAAKDAGLITDADEAKFLADAEAAVNRGQAFSMLDTMFASYNKLPGGKTIYTSFVDTAAPELTVNKPEATTDKGTLTITGAVKGDYAGVFLGSEPVTVNEDGTFSVEAKLAVGANTITVTAVDMVGNTAEASYSVTRNAGAAAKITASLPASIVAGEAADLAITVTDAEGTALEVAAADITVTVAGNVGTYDATTGKFTAAEKVGAGTVTVAYGTLTPATADVKVEAGELAQILADNTSVGAGETIKLTAADKYGNAIASGVTYGHTSTGIAVTAAGVVYTSAPGKYEITATAGEATAKTTVGVYGKVAGLQFDAPESIVANGASVKKITVFAVDEHGNPVGNYDGNVKLSSTGANLHKLSNGTGEIGASPAVKDDGTFTFYITVDRAMAGEEIVITAEDAASDKITGEVIVNAVHAVATTVKVTAREFFAANAASDKYEVSVKVQDQDGKDIESSFDVTATVTGPVKLVNDADVYSKSGATVAPAKFRLSNVDTVGVEGTINFTANVEGVGSGTAAIKHVIAGNPAKLGITSNYETRNSGQTFTVTVEVQDRNGVPVAINKGGEQIEISLPKAYSGQMLVNGKKDNDDAQPKDNKWLLPAIGATATEVEFTLAAHAKYTGPIDVTASLKYDDPVSSKKVSLSGAKSLTLTAAAAADIVFGQEKVEVPVANPKSNFSVSFVDAKGNAVAQADSTIKVYVKPVAGSDPANVTINGKKASATDAVEVKTDATGKATFEVVAKPYSAKEYALYATYTPAEGADFVTPDDETYLSVRDVVVANVSVRAYKQTAPYVPANPAATPPTAEVKAKFAPVSNIEAGDEFWVVATVTDNYGGYISTLADLGDGVLRLVAPGSTIIKGAGTTYTADEIDGGAVVFEEAADLGGNNDYPVGAGQFAVKVKAAKSGVAAIGAAYESLEKAISKTTNVNVTTATVASKIDAVRAADATLNAAQTAYVLTVSGANKIHGAYAFNLVDEYGNTMVLNANQKVRLSVTAAGGGLLTFRQSELGVTIDGFNIRSTSSLYFVATKADTYTVTIEYYDAEDDDWYEYAGQKPLVITVE